MSSVAKLVFSHWWDNLERPHRLLDQNFGLTIDERISAPQKRKIFTTRRFIREPYSHYYYYHYPYPPRNDSSDEQQHQQQLPFDYFLDFDRSGKCGSGCSVISNEKDKFHVDLDLRQFRPNGEITVKIVDGIIFVEGKHEVSMKDVIVSDHNRAGQGIGAVEIASSHHFIRKYIVPEQCDPEQTVSSLSNDGILTIVAPRKPETLQHKRVKTITIDNTGKPAGTTPDIQHH